jgi:hypothetical protein
MSDTPTAAPALVILDRLYYSSKAYVKPSDVLAVKSGDDEDTWSILSMPDGVRIRVIGSRATVLAALGIGDGVLPDVPTM